MKAIFISALFLFSCYVQAQKESWHWYFGDHAGIDFSSGSPVLVNGALSNYEGCASISDTNGALLFYTDGLHVYDQNHSQMPNGFGLLGDPSSTQSAIIIRMPGSSTIYYIFTVDYNWNGTSNGNGFCYSIVDMSLNSGFGDVTSKNVLIRLPVFEKVTAVKNGNNADYWILINDWQSDDIYAYLLTASGLTMIPVVSNAGPFHFMWAGNTAGYFKASRQGNKLALAMWEKNSFDICDFDNTTGIVSNHLVVQSPDMIYTYGAEFSPDGRFLYGTNLNPPCHLYQFDLSSGTASGILNSRIALDSSNILYRYSALQMAPDGKIYCAHRMDSTLGVVNNPDSLGMHCGYVDNGFSTGTHLSFLGLPNYPPDYVQSLPHAILQASSRVTCQEQCINFTDQSVNNPTFWQWYFSGASPSSSNDQNPSGVCYPVPGTYDVTLIVSNSIGSDTLYLPGYITVNLPPPVPVITQVNDTMYCGNATNFNAFQWYYFGIQISGATDSMYVATQSGTYQVEVWDSVGCRSMGFIQISTGISIGNDEASFAVSASPNSGELIIHIPITYLKERVTVSINNILGEIISEESFTSSNEKMLNIQDLFPGIYFIQLNLDGRNKTYRRMIIKQ